MIRPLDSSLLGRRGAKRLWNRCPANRWLERDLEQWETIRVGSFAPVASPAPRLARSQPSRPTFVGRLASLIGKVWGEFAQDKFWLSCMVAFALLWAVELWIVQKMTIESAQFDIWGPRYLFWMPKLRFAIDLCFTLSCALCLGRRGLVLACFLSLFFDLGLLAYTANYHRTFSLLTVYTQWNDGQSFAGFDPTLISKWSVVTFGAALVAKLQLVTVAARPRFSFAMKWGLVALCVAAYCGLMFTINQADPAKFSKLLNRRELAYYCASRGYALPWLMEWKYLGNRQTLQTALDDRKQSSDRLTPVESPLTVGDRLVIIQIESLGYDVIGARMNGHEVTPFLNQLKDQSYFYRVTAPVYNGSADADFSMLTGAEPSKTTVNYTLPAYPFDHALPAFLSNFNYGTTALLGGRGVVYNRRAAFEKMNFSKVLFAEEIVERYSGRIANLGVSDAELMGLSSLLMRQGTKKTCHFLVTVGSHAPFNTLANSQKEVFPNSIDANENYFNCVRHVDNTLRDYVMSLPANTTVVIYGDHTAPISRPGYQTDRDGTSHRVPYLIYNVGQNLSRSQRTRDSSVARGGQLTLTDMANYLRAQVAQSQASPSELPDLRLTANR
jgi:hypothetical protein